MANGRDASRHSDVLDAHPAWVEIQREDERANNDILGILQKKAARSNNPAIGLSINHQSQITRSENANGPLPCSQPTGPFVWSASEIDAGKLV
jgi:hypothetical protein